MATPGFSYTCLSPSQGSIELTGILFAQQIHERRQGLGLSLRDLARMTGITASTISRIENGKFSPTLDNAVKLAAALELDPPVASAVATPAEGGGSHHGLPSDLKAVSDEGVVAYRKIGQTLLKANTRRNISKVAVRNGYSVGILTRGAFQLRSINGFRENLKPGAIINCGIIIRNTFFAIASREAEILWIA